MSITRREFIERSLAAFTLTAVPGLRPSASQTPQELPIRYRHEGHFFVSQDLTLPCQILAQGLQVTFPKPGPRLDCFKPLCEIKIARLVAPEAGLKAFLDSFMDINSGAALYLAQTRITPKTPHTLILQPKLATVGMEVHSTGMTIVESATWLTFKTPVAVQPPTG